MSLVLVPAGCERPRSIRDGFFTVRKRTTREGTEYAYPVNSSIEYHCSPGYHLNGPDVLTCSGQRGWVPWTLPSCSPIDTGDQEEHSSGERQWFYIRLGSSVLMWFDVKKKTSEIGAAHQWYELQQQEVEWKSWRTFSSLSGRQPSIFLVGIVPNLISICQVAYVLYHDRKNSMGNK